MPIYVFIPYSLYVCATVAIKMATKLTDKFSLISALTLTSKFKVKW